MRLMDRSAIAFFAKAYPRHLPEPISLAWAMRAGLHGERGSGRDAGAGDRK